MLDTQAELLESAAAAASSSRLSAPARVRGDRGVDLSAVRWYEDAVALAADADVDVVVELIGGSDGIAKSVCETALENGKHVVTANKALLAHHGNELAAGGDAMVLRWPSKRRSPAASRHQRLARRSGGQRDQARSTAS